MERFDAFISFIECISPKTSNMDEFMNRLRTEHHPFYAAHMAIVEKMRNFIKEGKDGINDIGLYTDNFKPYYHFLCSQCNLNNVVKVDNIIENFLTGFELKNLTNEMFGEFKEEKDMANFLSVLKDLESDNEEVKTNSEKADENFFETASCTNEEVYPNSHIEEVSIEKYFENFDPNDDY